MEKIHHPKSPSKTDKLNQCIVFESKATVGKAAHRGTAIHLDIKCNSQQSRLQCSFNHFQEFLAKNPDRIIAQSSSGSFRGGSITEEIASGRRTFNRTQTAPDSAPHLPPI